MSIANLDGVVVLPLPDVPVQRQVAVWWRQDQPASPAVDAVRELLVSMSPPHWPWADAGGTDPLPTRRGDAQSPVGETRRVVTT
jgi:hypothetical protein